MEDSRSDAPDRLISGARLAQNFPTDLGSHSFLQTPPHMSVHRSSFTLEQLDLPLQRARLVLR